MRDTLGWRLAHFLGGSFTPNQDPTHIYSRPPLSGQASFTPWDSTPILQIVGTLPLKLPLITSHHYDKLASNDELGQYLFQCILTHLTRY